MYILAEVRRVIGPLYKASADRADRTFYRLVRSAYYRAARAAGASDDTNEDDHEARPIDPPRRTRACGVRHDAGWLHDLCDVAGDGLFRLERQRRDAHLRVLACA